MPKPLMVSRFQQQTIREQALSQTYIKHVSLIKMLRRISLFVHGNMNLMYGIGAITPLIVLNSLFLILVITVFRAVITVSSATLVHCLLWIGCYYNLLYVSRLLWYFVNFIVSYYFYCFLYLFIFRGRGWVLFIILFIIRALIWGIIYFHFFIGIFLLFLKRIHFIILL